MICIESSNNLSIAMLSNYVFLLPKPYIAHNYKDPDNLFHIENSCIQLPKVLVISFIYT